MSLWALPAKTIDPQQVTELAELGYTQAEMAQELKISVTTLQRRYAAAIEEGRRRRRRELRRTQYEVAQKGSVSMLNWLARQESARRQHDEAAKPEDEPTPSQLSDEELDEQIRSKYAEAYTQPKEGAPATGAAAGRKRAPRS